MKPDALRMLGWVIPIMCTAVAGWTLFRLNQDFMAAGEATKQAHRDNEKFAQELKLLQNLPAEDRYAAADDVPMEETAFLNYLRTAFQADNVTFENFSSISVEYGKDKVDDKMDGKTASLLKGIRRVSSTLTLKGPYANIRKLLGELELSNRLYTLNNLTWNSAKEGTVLTMTLTRYVAPPVPVPASAKPKAPSKTPIKVAPKGQPSIQLKVQPQISHPGITVKP